MLIDHVYETFAKSDLLNRFVYSIKLKVEFSILSSLGNLVREKRLVEIRSRTRQQIEREWTQMLDSNLERGHQQHQEALTSCRDDQRPADMGESMLFETASPPPKVALALEKARLRSSSSDTMGAGGGEPSSSKMNTYSIRGGGRVGKGRLYRPSASLSTFWEMASLSRSSKRGSSGTRDSGGSARQCPL
ncbi:hypothetical protein PG993_007747 [Apiospora rasikravindrae]|uniref:Uncharacterized protein n=1 Tax=Apiospora rasikravindrae TaxID=990691 RepID=A0ABR1SZS6_9PEZI